MLESIGLCGILTVAEALNRIWASESFEIYIHLFLILGINEYKQE